MLTERIQFELAMRRGANLKELLAQFTRLNASAIRTRITTLGYKKYYLTHDEWTHILKRRRVVENETPAQRTS
jgi:hypothetical protein